MEEKGLRSPLLNIDHTDLAFISLCCRAPDHLSEAAHVCASHHPYPDWPFQAYLPFLDPQKPESSPVVPWPLWPLLSWYPLLHLLMSQRPASTILLSPALLKLLKHRDCSETTEWWCSPKVSTQRLLEIWLFPDYSRECIWFSWWANELTGFWNQSWLRFSPQPLISWLIDWLSH